MNGLKTVENKNHLVYKIYSRKLSDFYYLVQFVTRVNFIILN